MRKDRVDMLSGSITKSLLSMIVPIMLTNVLTSLMNITDMTVLKIFSNEKAVGAVGACGALITLCTCLLIGISTGANVIVAKRIGAGDKERADKATMTAIMTAIVGGLALMVIGVLLAEPLLNLTNCRYAADYAQHFLCGHFAGNRRHQKTHSFFRNGRNGQIGVYRVLCGSCEMGRRRSCHRHADCAGFQRFPVLAQTAEAPIRCGSGLQKSQI